MEKRGYLGKDLVFEKPIHRSYSTREAKKNLLSDALKSSKRSTTIKINVKKKNEGDKTVSPPEKVVDVEDKDKKEKIDYEIIITYGKSANK